MIATTQTFRDAIVDSPRYIDLLAVVDISDPDKHMEPPASSPQAPWAKLGQLSNYDVTAPVRYQTLERGRTLLDGTFDLFPDSLSLAGEVGAVSAAVSGAAGVFPNPQWIELDFSNVNVLQACTLYFTGDPADGVAEDFTVEVYSGTQLFHTETVTGNQDVKVVVRKFTVYYPTKLRLTVTKWSIPHRRMRAVEFALGLMERWTGNDLESFTATLQGQFSCLSLPYGSVNLAMDNTDRRFEPRRKDSLFQSIEERQGVELFIGCRTSNGMEHVKIGMFYQAGDGWKTSQNAPTMSWYLVDIIGLIADRTFLPPSSLPSTLGGWVQALVSQLGEAFYTRYQVDPAYSGKSVIANSREDVTGKKCGDILRWACQATGTWPRADAETGKLCVEPLWSQGNKITLDNLEDYPTMKANESLAALIFQLALPPLPEPEPDENGNVPEVEDTREKEIVITGNSTSSEKTVTIINPFIHSKEEAMAAARLILAQYGGNLYETTGRGDPSSEIGDVDTIWLDESNATTARRMSQTFQFQGGVLRGCRSTLLQADGSYLWEQFAVITESGTFTAPPGVHQLRVVIGQGGQGGGGGSDGYIRIVYSRALSIWHEQLVDYPTHTGFFGFVRDDAFEALEAGEGEAGLPGSGGKVWFGVIPCNEGQQFAVNIGAGGAGGTVFGEPGGEGEHSTFGMFSSENGELYENGYTDIANGQAFSRPGVPVPLPGTGDGGAGGKGGEAGEGYGEPTEYINNWGNSVPGQDIYITKLGGSGAQGAAGGSGFVMVTWDKPTT